MKIAELPVPIPQPSEVLIRIEYTSVNPVDWKIREGHMKEVMPHRFPVTLGWDAAGVVEAAGVRATHFHVGDKVFAFCRKEEVHDGTYAEYISVDESKVAIMPKNLSFRDAAAVPLAGLTAWQALFDVGQYKAGESLLIQGGAGGVGSFAIQFAKAKSGGRLFVTARAEHEAYLKSLGADVVIDYTKKNVIEEIKRELPTGLDVILDLVGGPSSKDVFSIIKRGGRLVSTVDVPDPAPASKRGVRVKSMFVEGNGRQLDEIARLIEQEWVKPPQIEEFDLSQVAAAHKKSESHHTVGKLVLRVH